MDQKSVHENMTVEEKWQLWKGSCCVKFFDACTDEQRKRIFKLFSKTGFSKHFS